MKPQVDARFHLPKTRRHHRGPSVRRWWLASMLCVPAAVGCNGSGMSLASLNPFDRSAPGETLDGTAIAAKPAETSGTPGQLASVTTSAKDALSKAGNAVGGVFKREPSLEEQAAADDPLSLDNKPETVDPKVYVASGQLWESTGNVAKAIENYERALAVDPNHAGALSNLARLHYRQSDFPAAAEAFQRALKQSPNDAQLYNELGLTLHKLGRTDMAVTVMRRALELSPGTSRFANNLASVLHDAGQADQAYQVLVQNNKPAVAHFNMAYLQYKSGNASAARVHLNEAIKFESMASSDAAVGRAVSRSRDMLAQINAVSPSPAAAPAMPNSPASPTTAPVMTASTSAAAGPVARVASTKTPPSAPAPGFAFPAANPNQAWPVAKPAAAQSSTAAQTAADGQASQQIPAWLKEATAKVAAKQADATPSPTAAAPKTQPKAKPAANAGGFTLPTEAGK